MKPSFSTAVVMATAALAFLVSAHQVIRASDARETSVMGWQTYCAFMPAATEAAPGPARITRLPDVSPTFRSGYAYKRDRELVARDLTSGKEYRFDGKGFVPTAPSRCPAFATDSHIFEQTSGFVSACAIDGGDCVSEAVLDGTWPYVFAEHQGRVLSVTNYGDVLIFDGRSWCRAGRRGDTYSCATPDPLVTEPRKVQFYSSVDYMGLTLVGEWPTGRIYEFDGESLRPARLSQPPFVTDAPVGYEAQSMAEYCGDLLVGYWPRGEIWRRSRQTGDWSLLARLFSHPSEGEAFIPYSDREPDDLPYAFYGQRVTAIVPVDGHLYAVTSNLGAWEDNHRADLLATKQETEYGAIYRITGC